MDTYDPDSLIKFSDEVLTKYFEERHAMAASQVLVEADLRGIRSHGLAGGTGIEELLLKQKQDQMNARPNIHMIDTQYATIVTIDADGALGHAASFEAMAEAMQIAEHFGTATVYVINSTHFGAAGIYSEMIAAEGYAARVTTTSPAWVAPFGSTRKRLGTNPIAWSIPYADGIVTIDMATCQRAVSPILSIIKMRDPEEPVDLAALGLADYLVGPDGKSIDILLPEHDYRYVVDNCSIRPLGGEQFGYKGSGLAFLVELFNVMGGALPGGIRSGDRSRSGRVSHTFEAVAVDAMPDAMDALTDNITGFREEFPEVLLPGEKEQREASRCRLEGVTYSDDESALLQRIAEQEQVELR